MSDDYGVRIAAPNSDALNDLDSSMLFTTKYSTPKANLWTQYNLSTQGNPLIVPHGIGDIPFLLCYGTGNGLDKVLAYYNNFYDLNNVLVTATADVTNIRLQILAQFGTPNKLCYPYVFFPEI